MILKLCKYRVDIDVGRLYILFIPHILSTIRDPILAPSIAALTIPPLRVQRPHQRDTFLLETCTPRVAVAHHMHRKGEVL